MLNLTDRERATLMEIIEIKMDTEGTEDKDFYYMTHILWKERYSQAMTEDECQWMMEQVKDMIIEQQRQMPLLRGVREGHPGLELDVIEEIEVKSQLLVDLGRLIKRLAE